MSKKVVFFQVPESSEVFCVAKELLGSLGDEYVLTTEYEPDKCKDAGAIFFINDKSAFVAEKFRFHTQINVGGKTIVFDAGETKHERGIKRGPSGREAFDTFRYPELEIEKTARVAFEWAEKRGKSIISVDSADMTEVGKLWRTAVQDVAQDYLAVSVRCELFSEFFLKIINKSYNDDIILTNRLSGGIISRALRTGDENVVACLVNDTPFAAFGVDLRASKQTIADLVALMLEESFDRPDQAEKVRKMQYSATVSGCGKNLTE